MAFEPAILPNMLFSIVTVCFNSEAVIDAAAASLAEQTCRDFEWVVVDGASSDLTLERVESYEALPKKVLSEPDAGIYDAMNKALRLAEGEYVFFLNSDDRLHDAGVLDQVRALLLTCREPPDLVIGQVIQVAGHVRTLRTYNHLSPRRLLFDSLCHQALFARRTLFERFGDFDTRYRMSADYDWLLRVVRGGGRIAHLARPVAVFAADGAHSRHVELTRAEAFQIRANHGGRWELPVGYFVHGWYDKLRRGLGWPSVGRHPLR